MINTHWKVFQYLSSNQLIKSTFSGRWPEAGVSNVYSGVVGGVDGGAVGVVVAHWSSSAALTPFVFAWPPILVAAGLSWNHNTHWVSLKRTWTNKSENLLIRD